MHLVFQQESLLFQVRVAFYFDITILLTIKYQNIIYCWTILQANVRVSSILYRPTGSNFNLVVILKGTIHFLNQKNQLVLLSCISRHEIAICCVHVTNDYLYGYWLPVLWIYRWKGILLCLLNVLARTLRTLKIGNNPTLSFHWALSAVKGIL